jgi:hypothetical protein
VPNINLPLNPMGIFVPALEWTFPNGTWTATRGAGGNYFMRKTAGAATTNPAVNLNKAIARTLQASPSVQSVNAPQGSEIQGGGLFTGFDLIYAIGTAGLTSLTPALYETLYQNNTAPAITSPGGVINSSPTSGVAVPITTQAQPYDFKFALTTPYLIGQNFTDVSDWLELVVVDPGTSVFDLYGVMLKFDANR